MSQTALHQLQAVGRIHSPYKEKFSVPRQPGLVTAGEARLQLLPPFDDPLTLEGITQFSHLWLLFVFHECLEQGWQPRVRPPRLGGNQKVGVFATRSPFRPNGLGLSVVRLLGVTQAADGLWLELEGVDLVDGTPIVDIKPYVPFADSLPAADGGFAPAPPATREVSFTPEAQAQLAQARAQHPTLETFLVQVLGQDPRPAYKQQAEDAREYGVHLYDYNVRWQVQAGRIQVLAIDPWQQSPDKTIEVTE
ncbi:tRNA (N6-threonylcarbamoyladenosine(37)-N6)-methyltransferase TrmO [Pseudaeromonas sp. ZJS20]|uniref:tRNA (N6-threonylcarbamoyladenosine(37)-N6)-methyltransferase TrmO n=1 Tax=Pseudaeromonas aegiceratis TaxID=3153928 RepID=UPI00390C5AFA